MAREAELLNNAIARLSLHNQDNEEVQELTEDWVWWWRGWRNVIPETTPVWWAALQYYFQRYKSAYERAKSKSPDFAPDIVDPTIPRVIAAQVDRYVEAWSDAGTEAIHVASQTAEAALNHGVDAARKLLPAVAPWLLGGVAIYLLTRRI